MNIRKKEYDKKRYIERRIDELGLDPNDPDLEKKVYTKKHGNQKKSRYEAGVIGAQQASIQSHRYFDRYFKNWCMNNNRMEDYEIYKKKQQT